MQKLASREVAALDPYTFMAWIGKRVIHPGGRAFTESKGVLADEGFAHSLSIMGRVATRPAHVRKMVWLMPRMAKAVPYLGYIPVAGRKPVVSRRR